MNAPARLMRNLTLWHVVIIGLAYIQPLTVLDTFGMVSRDSNGHATAAYIIALCAILLTVLSYGKMIQIFDSAGSAYTYAQRAISPEVGFMVGWTSWLDYLLMPMVNIVLARIYLKDLFPEVNIAFWVIGFTALMTGVNLFGAKIVAYFNSWIVFLQVGVIALFSYMIYAQLNADNTADGTGTFTGFDLSPLYSTDATLMSLVTGATILVFSFAGFDSLSTLSEETQDAKRIIPRAMLITALTSGVLFIIASYFMQFYFPSHPAIYFELVDETQPEILQLVGGAAFKAAVLTFTIITVMASGISAHAGVSRLMYVMGRDGVINRRFFGQLHPTLKTPTNNILVAGALALTGGFFSLEFILSLINFGALTAFSSVNLSVIFWYVIRKRMMKTPKDVLTMLVLPALGFLSIVVMWMQVNRQSFLAGLTWAGVGFAYLLYKSRLFSRPLPLSKE